MSHQYSVLVHRKVEEEQLDLATALSLADQQVDANIQEEEDIDLAMAASLNMLELQRREQNSYQRALQDSAPSHDNTLINDDVEIDWDGVMEDLEALFEVIVDGMECPVEKKSDENLPSIYRNYRLVPTLFSEEHMWPLSAIQRQQRELHLARGNEEVKDWTEGQCESLRCLVCLTNVATRVAVPCGHRLCCRPCVNDLIEKKMFYSVTIADGSTVPTDRRLPSQCFTCRAIIGQIITVH